MRAGTPKQWVPVSGKPLIAYSIETFERHPLIHSIYIGVDQDHVREGERALAMWAPTKGREVYIGGERRQDTVWYGLGRLSEETLVGIHDAARPLVTPDLITRVIEKAQEKGAAIPVIPLRDTIKEVEGDRVIRTLERRKMRAIQTPQFFEREIIERAYREALDKGAEATDDAALVEAAGYNVWCVDGEEGNLKVTYAEDIEQVSVRTGGAVAVGFGYDVHPLLEGRRLILGGVEMPSPKGLYGHSDADVLSHAVVDALLGGAGLGDIGLHFPDTDPQYWGESSLTFLERAASLLRKGGWEIRHIDATLVMEAPRIAPYRQRMIELMAQALGIPPCCINIKATTTEGLGFAGRQEGIAAYAVATLQRWVGNRRTWPP